MHCKKSPLWRLYKEEWLRKNAPRILIVIDYENIRYLTDRLNMTLNPYKIGMLGSVISGQIIKKLFYAGIFPEVFPERRLVLDSFELFGFEQQLKPIKFLVKDDGTKAVKGDLDVDIAVDIMSHTLNGGQNFPDYDLLLFFGGDGDYAYLFERVLKKSSKQILIFSGDNHMGIENRLLIEKRKDLIRYINIADCVEAIGNYNYERGV